MEEVIKLNSVDQYNQMYGLETLHPSAASDVYKRQPSITDCTLCF